MEEDGAINFNLIIKNFINRVTKGDREITIVFFFLNFYEKGGGYGL